MTFSQHIATASILSKLTGLPIIGVAIGFISHIILDTVEPQEHKMNFIRPDYDMLVLEVLLSLIMFWMAKGNIIMMWTIAGAVAPDLIDGGLSLIDIQRYQTGQHLFWFHRPKKTSELMKNQTIILSLIMFMMVLLLV